MNKNILLLIGFICVVNGAMGMSATQASHSMTFDEARVILERIKGSKLGLTEAKQRGCFFNKMVDRLRYDWSLERFSTTRISEDTDSLFKATQQFCGQHRCGDYTDFKQLDDVLNGWDKDNYEYEVDSVCKRLDEIYVRLNSHFEGNFEGVRQHGCRVVQLFLQNVLSIKSVCLVLSEKIATILEFDGTYGDVAVRHSNYAPHYTRFFDGLCRMVDHCEQLQIRITSLYTVYATAFVEDAFELHNQEIEKSLKAMDAMYKAGELARRIRNSLEQRRQLPTEVLPGVVVLADVLPSRGAVGGTVVAGRTTFVMPA